MAATNLIIFLIINCRNLKFVPPQLPYFCPPPEDFCDTFCVTGSAFGRPCEISASNLLPFSYVPSPFLPLPSLLCPPPSAVYPLLPFPFSLSLVSAAALKSSYEVLGVLCKLPQRVQAKLLVHF